MAIKFKRSFIGYSPALVDERLSDLDQKFILKSLDLRQVLADQVNKRDLVKGNVDRLKKDLAAKLALQDEIARRLVSAHLKATEKVIEAIKDVEQNEAKIANSIGVQKKELQELCLSSSNINDGFLTLARYRTMLGGGKVGDEEHD